MQKVQATLAPFHLHRKTIEVPSGLTLQQIVEHLVPRKQRGISICLTVDGDEVLPFMWNTVKPEQSSLVGLIVTAPGKSGSKNPLATILSIAIMVAAPYAAAAAAGVAAGTAVTAMTASQFAVYATVRVGLGIVGYLATSMLSSTPNQARANNPKESPTQFIEGASNELIKYGVIPANLGKNRMFPPQCAFPYPETVNNQQYSRQLFTWGYGNVIITNRRIGETSIDEFDNVTMDDRLESDLNLGTSLYTDDVFPEGYSITLSEPDGFTTRTTQLEADEAMIDITFLGGLTTYSGTGQRTNRTVEFEIQYAPVGTPEISDDWSTGVSGKLFGASTITVPNPPRNRVKKHILIKNIDSGVLKILTWEQNQNNTQTPPSIPENYVRLASFDSHVIVDDPYEAEIINFVDDRATSIPDIITDSGSFVPTVDGMDIDVTDGTFAAVNFIVTAASGEAVRVSRPFEFPERGQYDVRVRRVTEDADDDKIRDVATWTFLRSITWQAPVNQADISGTAMRIKASDQLNGLVDRFNGDVETIILDYFVDSDAWLLGPSSNPASIYRYVLQAPAFVKRVGDERINLTKLEEWHAYCVEKGLTYNRVIDYNTSVEDVLNDIAAAGMATPHYVDGIYGVIIDNERDEIKGMVNPRNSWGYSGNITYPEMPHALRVEFRNKEKGYSIDEVIVYADGYTSANATLFERLSFLSCTDSDLAWFYGRMYYANALLQPEVHKFSQDFENLTYNRGQRITFCNDVILVGAGSGRIKTVIEKPGDPTKLIGFTLDEIVTIPSANQFAVRIRHADASAFTYYLLDTVIGETDTFTFTDEVDYDSVDDAEKWITSLCNFVEDGEELDLVVTDIKNNADQSAIITAINYAPERFDAATGTIPPFDSHITVPLDLQQPLPPTLGGEIQSDENVMLKNSDNSYVGRMIIPLTNPNENSVVPVVRVRSTGATVWSRANVLSSDPSLLILTGFDDGQNYDIEIRYKRPQGRQLLSFPLVINNQRYIGADTDPSQVQNFKVVISGETILFSWDKNPEIDIAYYTLRYSSLFSGATYATAQPVAAQVYENRLTLPYQGGTYFIKAVDILGNESADDTAVITFDASAVSNVLATLTEQPAFSGTHDNTIVSEGSLVIDDISLGIGTYYFANNVSLGDIFDCILSASVIANGVFRNDVFEMTDIFTIDDIFGSGDNDVFTMSDIFDIDDLFGIGTDSWRVTLQYRVSQDNGGTWSAWTDFVAGHVVGSDFEFRIVLESLAPNVSPSVNTVLEVMVDMPDRIERGEDIACDDVTGAVITYPAAFRNNPAVAITIQNGDADDKLEFVSKDETGFTVKVYNTTTVGYVDRILDYISSGYGRVQS